ncbi:hypothetical protein AMTRI_Chr03g51670 [Amborella trichopoda]|uniref:Uncharacterized protein n=1 Tax=Amborella trichopoda TaxID=13333 RepID=U5D5B3_AMBTC|nr:uncharacterized protein LOC18443808 [Amborella trichopoda]ERN15518.1 hypothetical protein AMTR_s00048p00079610 [Amborella trichopoda]|eukprot:XP_020529034.1 uncharacterized protein LOC18443808 [Amborella trichopoda]
MQRQSLGSPSGHGRKEGREETESVRQEMEKKGDNPIRMAERFVHFIPVLMIMCLLVLYLFSYDPSSEDLAKVGGFEDILEQKKGDFTAIYNHRSLQEARPHRKFGNF